MTIFGSGLVGTHVLINDGGRTSTARGEEYLFVILVTKLKKNNKNKLSDQNTVNNPTSIELRTIQRVQVRRGIFLFVCKFEFLVLAKPLANRSQSNPGQAPRAGIKPESGFDWRCGSGGPKLSINQCQKPLRSSIRRFRPRGQKGYCTLTMFTFIILGRLEPPSLRL